MPYPVAAARGSKQTSQAAAASPLLTGLVAYYALDEVSDGSGPVQRNDSHTNGYHLTTDTNTVVSASGKIGNCARFEKDDADRLISGTIINWAGSWSIVFWCTYESLPAMGNYHVIANLGGVWGGGCGPSIKLAYNEAMACLFYRGNDNNEITVHAEMLGVGADTWVMLAFTYDHPTKTLRAYTTRTGSVAASGSVAHAWASLDVSKVVFYLSNGTYDGDIDEVGVWSRALSLEEIETLYNSGAGLAYPFS